MEQALKDSVRTVTPGSRSLGPKALASPGLLGSADSGGLHGACTQRQFQNHPRVFGLFGRVKPPVLEHRVGHFDPKPFWQDFCSVKSYTLVCGFRRHSLSFLRTLKSTPSPPGRY